MIGIWVRLLTIPYRLLFPCIVVFCCIGIYSVNNSTFDVVMAGVFGLVGYWMAKHDFEPAPLVLGWVLGPLMEENLRRAILISHGDYTVFFTQPISASLLALAAGILLVAVLPAIRRKRETVFVEE
jgi:putative tricarboxylic transport membrane protein